jgi:hypothetical protein
MNPKYKIIMLSATIADNPKGFHIFGYMLEFYKTLRSGHHWLRQMAAEDLASIESNNKNSAISKQIYPLHGSRMQVSELGDMFPLNQVNCECYSIKKAKRDIVNQAFGVIEKNDIYLKSNLNPDQKKHILSEITKARQLIELEKLCIFKELASEYIQNGFAVGIFLNFTESILSLAKDLKTTCILSSTVTSDQFQENIKLFQDNESDIIICSNSSAEGYSLHDLHGKPRVSLVSASFSSKQLIQILGRMARAGGQTPTLQRIIYCGSTCEEIICNRVKVKLEFLSTLNDNDLVKIDNL